MFEQDTHNIYCDESCHLENDHIPVMALGAIICNKRDVDFLSGKLRQIKVEHGLSRTFEVKWTKVSPSIVKFYLALIDLFIFEQKLRFRGLLVPDKSELNHKYFNQSHDDWYYKMYFTMLKYLIDSESHKYSIYIDIKDTRGSLKMRKLQTVLTNSLHDFNRQRIKRVQQIRSHESEILPLADLLVGALTYANRELNGSTAKLAIVNRLREQYGQDALTKTTNYRIQKFNILNWQAQETVG